METIVDKRSAKLKGYSFYLYKNELGIQLADGCGGGYANYSSPALALTTNVWHLVAATVQRRGSPHGAITWYLDGVQQGTPSVPTQVCSLANDVPLRIGASSPAFARSFFNGSLDELEIFNRVLTAKELAAIFTSGPSGKCKP